MSRVRVLVTGASGRLGRSVRRALGARSDVAATYAVGPGSAPAEGDVVLDLEDSGSITRSVDRAAPEVVVHLAGLVGPACSDPSRTRVVNVESVGELARASSALGSSRFIFASSAAVYGDQYREPAKEDSPLVGASPYALSKIAAEGELAAVARHYPSVSVVALRIFNLYGEEFDDSLVEKLRNSTPDQPARLIGASDFTRDYIHADDVSRAIVAALSVPEHPGFAAVNVGTGEGLTSLELVQRLSGARRLWFENSEGGRTYSVANTDLFEQTFGFRPRPIG